MTVGRVKSDESADAFEVIDEFFRFAALAIEIVPPHRFVGALMERVELEQEISHAIAEAGASRVDPVAKFLAIRIAEVYGWRSLIDPTGKPPVT